MRAAGKNAFHFIALVAVVAFAATASHAASGADDRPAERREITALVSKWEQAWNSHDMFGWGQNTRFADPPAAK
jgi:hypothetical protein